MTATADYSDLVCLDVPATGEALSVDKKTPDTHVRRDPHLLRLTGAHPFNAEAPLTELYEQGFITPHRLHYVRNHGYATSPPEGVDAAEAEAAARNWTITVDGVCDAPYSITLGEIMDTMPTITLPVTLVCAGNRRKEQNKVKKSLGFDWGAGGVSTSLWTGTPLWNVLTRAKPNSESRYVCMEGAETLPKGPYGSCVRREWAMDYHRGIMLAWKQNGISLAPDHGWPVRLIIPGVIGGRSIKWLKHLSLSTVPSTNYYHLYDNRVLPTMVDDQTAKNDASWFHDERYAIYNLNLQSVVVYPQHNEQLSLSSKDSNNDDSRYNIRGFAYNGGGIRIGRIEVSLDKGKSWLLTNIRYPEDEYTERGITELYGGKVDLADRYLRFCWCFWSVEVATSQLLEAKDIVVRAMDENMNLQPRDMYWNALSQMNNCWFRVAIRAEPPQDDAHGQAAIIRFEHPTNLAAADGWMDRVRAEGGDPLAANWGEMDGAQQPTGGDRKPHDPPSDIVMTNPDKAGTVVSRAELALHANEDTPWFVVNGEVYDGSKFLENHPGGPSSIILAAGDDATSDFMAIHSDKAKTMLAQYHVGTLDTSEASAEEEATTNADGTLPAENSPTFLNPKKWKPIALIQETEVSPDSRLFTFHLDHPDQTSGLPVGQHLYVRSNDEDGNFVVRAYTPVSCNRTKGVLDLLVKLYPHGHMSRVLRTLAVGDHVEVKGPLGEFEYLGSGEYKYRGHCFHSDTFVMVAGGSGITPCYQLLRELAYSKDTDPKLPRSILLYGNRYEHDILCRNELEDIARRLGKTNSPLSLEYWLSADNAAADEAGGLRKGRIASHTLAEQVQQLPRENTITFFVCGPTGLVETVQKWVHEEGYAAERLVIF